jgi:hypothetical protein
LLFRARLASKRNEFQVLAIDAGHGLRTTNTIRMQMLKGSVLSFKESEVVLS